MLLILSNQNSFSSTIRIFNMQKTSRINSDQSSIVDNQKERKLTTPNRSNNTVASRDASDTPRSTSTNAQHIVHRAAARPPTQHLDHPHSTSTIRAAHRPPTQRIDHRAAPLPPTQRIVHQHSTSATNHN